jgi:fucose permease
MITTATGIGGVVFTAVTGILADSIGIRLSIAALAGCFVFAVLAVAGLRGVERKKQNR